MGKSIANWTLWHALVMLLATLCAVVFHAPFLLIWAVSFSLAIFIALNYQTWIRLHPAGGYANHVTFARFVLLIFVLATQSVMHAHVFAVLVVVVMIADGVDGYLARRFNQCTAFGEVFDMEVDAFLAVSLAFQIWRIQPDAWWVLLAGTLRYVFALLYRVIGWHGRKRPSMPEAKVFAVIFFLSLLTPFIFEWNIAEWTVAAGCGLVTISFLREYYLYYLIRENK